MGDGSDTLFSNDAFGVVRFDGETFTPLRLFACTIGELAIDPSGAFIYAGTRDGGLYRYTIE